MGVAVKVDEDLPRSITQILRDAGHEACSVYDQKLSGVKDSELWTRVQADCRLLLTADKGFADLRRFPPGTHAGVVLLRLAVESRQGYRWLVGKLLATQPLESFVGAITVVTPDRIRTRRP